MANTQVESKTSDHNEFPGSSDDFFDFVGILVWIWRKKLTFIVVTTVFVVGAIIIALLAPVVFTARVTMLPQDVSSHSDLLGQVQSFTGISLSNDTSYEQLYGEILFSDKILDRVISRNWKFSSSQGEVSLFNILMGETRGFDSIEPLSISKLKKLLRLQVIEFFRDDRTGYMFLEVTVPEDPELAADLANFLTRELDLFNRDIRSKRAEENCNFISKRLEEVSSDLQLASNDMTEFLSANRTYQNSPVLYQKYMKIEREVQAQTSVWIELRKQLELAKIDLNKELKSVNILDIAVIPTQKSGPNRTFIVIIGAILGLIFSFILILVRELVIQARKRIATISSGQI